MGNKIMEKKIRYVLHKVILHTMSGYLEQFLRSLCVYRSYIESVLLHRL